MIFRKATAEDIPEIASVVARMVEGTKFLPPTHNKLRRVVANWYTECVWIDGRLAAFMAGTACETFLNDEFNAYEKGLFVVPEHRGGTLAVRLVKNFEAWARAQGAKKVWLGQSVGQNQKKTLRFFERLGYESQGFTTCKELQ